MQKSQLPDPVLDAQFYEGVAIKRLFAWFFDVIIVFAICLGLIILTLGIGAFIFPFIAFVANLGYRIFCLSKWSATLGMRVLGIEIRNMHGDRLETSEASLHTILHVFIMISGLGAVVNIVTILATDRGQGLHDLILGTTAINRPLD